MRRRILFIHSAGPQDSEQGSGQLIKYLHKSLGTDYALMCPAMPDPENPAYNAWKRKLDTQLDLIDDEVILIGHSLGGSVLVKYFSEIPYQKPVAGLFLIASPFWGQGGWDSEEYRLKDHFATHLSFIPKIFLYHSRDDEWVPFHHMSLYAAKLTQSTVRKFDAYGHIFDHPFPELIHDIRRLQLEPNNLTNKIKSVMNTANIVDELKLATEELLNVLAEFDKEQINQVPSEGSWTGGQVAEHLLKSETGLPDLLAENVKSTERPADEKVPVIESIFLNFETKLKAPDFIIPSNGPHEKDNLVNSLKETREKILSIADTVDLSKTCTAAQFPGMGELTRLEWINFVICHSIRHTRQLRNILAKV